VKSREYATVTKASFFGVGAPEALVIGVVALLVFGPKGLAEAARSVGQALRAFQPTIRELQEVSNEFKTTLEKEIGYEEIKNDIRGAVSGTSVPKPKPAGPLPKDAKPIEEVAKEFDDVMEIEPKKMPPTLSAEEDVVTEEMKQKAASAAWGTDAADAVVKDVVKDVVEATPAAPKVEATPAPKVEKQA
jgi:TatA/E family protein of Tat protein translocase